MRAYKQLAAMTAAMVWALAACSNEATVGVDAQATAADGLDGSAELDGLADSNNVDAIPELPLTDGAGADTEPAPDVTIPADAACSDPGCACKDNNGCNSGFCIEVNANLLPEAYCSFP